MLFPFNEVILIASMDVKSRPSKQELWLLSHSMETPVSGMSVVRVISSYMMGNIYLKA